MNRLNLRCEVEGLSLQEAQVRIALVALAVISVAIAITASALNAIAISRSQTESPRNNPTHTLAKFRGDTLDYGIPYVAMPKGKKTFPPELVPVD
jgi:hypothetical protein